MFDENYKIVFERSARFIETSDEDGFHCENLDKKHWSEIPELTHLVAKHHPISPKFYPENETENEDPFIEVIEKTGKIIALEKLNIKVI